MLESLSEKSGYAPVNVEEARRMGINWYKHSIACPTHNTRFRWASTGECMACVPADKIGLSPRRKRAPLTSLKPQPKEPNHAEN